MAPALSHQLSESGGRCGARESLFDRTEAYDRLPPIAAIRLPRHIAAMTNRILKRASSLAPTIAKVAVFLGGAYYVGFVTTLFEGDLGWHMAPVGVLMLCGSVLIAEWVERRLEARKASRS